MISKQKKGKGVPYERIAKIMLSLIPSMLVLALRPFSMTSSQAAVTAFLLVTIIWWVTKLVDRTIASVILLLSFCLFGNTPVTGVFTFPLSENFILIVLSFLFSEGVRNSGILDKLLLPLLTRWATTVGRTLVSMLVVNLVMIFVVPQPFSRVILVAMIYDSFFRQIGATDPLRRSMLFYLHIQAILVNMAFLRGDLILNHAMLAISGATFNEWEWIKHMAVPSLLWSAVSIVAARLIFRKSFSCFPVVTVREKTALDQTMRRNLIILAVVLLAWATEGLHGISGTIIVGAGIILMIPMKIIRFSDLRCIDVKLLVFLTAAFSIGSVMKTSGTAQVIFSQFTLLLPRNFSLYYLLIVLLVSMAMHMILGSSITAMSVVIPSMLVICDGVVPTTVLLFSIYIVCSAHCVLPHHQVITMIGEGKGYFQSKEMSRYGLLMTVPSILFILLAFYGWWYMIGAV